MAQRTEVRLGSHGHGLPAACPAEQGVGGCRGIDGIKENDGHEGRKEAEEGRGEHHGRMERGVVANLEVKFQLSTCLMFISGRALGLTCGTLLQSRPAMLATVTMLLPATRAIVGRKSKEAGHIDSQPASCRRVEL